MALLEFANRRGIDAIHWLLQGIPGLAAWRRGDRERGMVLFGSFASALSMAIFAWGTTLGVLMILVVFAAHVAALVDLIAADFLTKRFRADRRLQVGGYCALLLGAGLMSLIAIWA